ncbi:SAM-dependent methyltransferase [Neolewinella marina]|uniref:SAM-dependent methyltransferase n=1 Tax=Neolewinella marina TaxID=438751 RepID=A0A2G0CKP1_9BACT|nr:SAM-dependent methyltransferase [Neolewinella marina]
MVHTADGSHSLHSPRFGVNYHSTHGALQESRHVFIEAGLHPLLTGYPPGQPLRILEMGFGTGLNALLVRQIARAYPDHRFYYTTFERFPVPAEVVEQLNYPEVLGVEPEFLHGLHAAPWEEAVDLDPNFTLLKRQADFLSDQSPDAEPCDLIFYDAFAPENQPELWSVEAMRHCARRLRTGGVLVTYCAKGQFKRNLRAAGFRVEALPGPPGKREMTRAHVIDLA